jgi:hypothetical protein
MHTSTGIFEYDAGMGHKHYDPWWGLLYCDEGITQYYAWLMRRHGIETYSNDLGLWGAHISVLKGEIPPKPELWGKYQDYEVQFHYSHIVRSENGKHAWVDVYSEELSAIREELGFPFKPWFHLTIGRLVRPITVNFSQNLT